MEAVGVDLDASLIFEETEQRHLPRPTVLPIGLQAKGKSMVALLYLRPFEVDGARLLRRALLGPLRARKTTITDIVAESCRDRGVELRAIADPQGSHGVGRVVTDEVWERHVEEAAAAADGAIVVAGASPGTAWEMRILAVARMPVLVLRNPLLAPLDAGLLQAAAFDAFGGDPLLRDRARDALAIVKPANGNTDTISAPMDDKCVASVVAGWVRALTDLVDEGWLQSPVGAPTLSAESAEVPMRNLIAVAAGLRRAIRELDDRRDLLIRIGEEGERALVGFSLARACITAPSPHEMQMRLALICAAYNGEGSHQHAEPEAISAIYLKPPVEDSALQMHFVSEILLRPKNWAIIQRHGAAYIDFASQVARVCAVWTPRLEAAARSVWG
ncbi:MAG: hypothetical protein AB7T59_00455 [Hyphomonadaceae bacterium]